MFSREPGISPADDLRLIDFAYVGYGRVAWELSYFLLMSVRQGEGVWGSRACGGLGCVGGYGVWGATARACRVSHLQPPAVTCSHPRAVCHLLESCP